MTRELFQYHPVLGYHFVPGLRCRVDHESGGYLVKVNQAGFRCEHEVTPRKPPGTFRVLLFGDSYTAGDGVSNRHRWGDVLEQLVPESQVLNFGLSGTGTDEHYLVFRELAREIEYDLVVIAVFVQNIRRVGAHYRTYASAEEGGRLRLRARPYFALDGGGELTLHHQPVPRDPVPADELPAEERNRRDRGGRLVGLRRMVNALGVQDLAQKLTRYQPVSGFDRPDDPAWLLMRAILTRWIAEIPTPVIVMPLPLYQHVEETASAAAYQARFASLADPPRVVVHDPLPDFHRVPKERRRALRFERDVHLTPEGNRVVAESLAPLVRSLRPAREHA